MLLIKIGHLNSIIIKKYITKNF